MKCWENAKSQSFYARDNVCNFLKWCRKFGVRDAVIFESEDLVSHANPRNVVLCLLEIARIACTKYRFSPAPGLVQFEQEIDELEGDAESEVDGWPCVDSNARQPPLSPRKDAATTPPPCLPSGRTPSASSLASNDEDADSSSTGANSSTNTFTPTKGLSSELDHKVSSVCLSVSLLVRVSSVCRKYFNSEGLPLPVETFNTQIFMEREFIFGFFSHAIIFFENFAFFCISCIPGRDLKKIFLLEFIQATLFSCGNQTVA